MGNKILTISIVSVLVLGLLGAGIWAFIHFSDKGSIDTTSATSDDGLAEVTATFYDFSGDPSTGGVVQALVGGTAKRTHVSFELKASNTGDVDLTDVQTANPNANMNGAFDNINPLASLLVGESSITVGNTKQSCTTSADCDSNEECVGDPSFCAIALDNYASGSSQHNVDFTVSLQGSYVDAVGSTQTITSDPVTLTYDIREEICSDGTTINSCVFDRTGVEADKPSYCEFTEGSAPAIVDKASVCGCPTGYEVSGDSCVESTCSDGTTINTCSTVTTDGTYGAYMYCQSDKTLVAGCNQCGCTDDYYGNPATGCSAGTDPASCTYQTYSGGLSGEVGEA